MKSVNFVIWIARQIFTAFEQVYRLYFYLFDQFILYPLMRKIAKTYSIDFLNLGYMPLKEDNWINWRDGEENLESLAQKAHYDLYEKALSLCPLYPKFKNLELVDVGCGIGGGIRGLKK